MNVYVCMYVCMNECYLETRVGSKATLYSINTANNPLFLFLFLFLFFINKKKKYFKYSNIDSKL